MTSANRVRITFVRESTLGTTPGSPRMRTARFTSESLAFNPEYLDSDEIRSDRMLFDPIPIMQSSGGGVNGELHFPKDNEWMSDLIRSAMWAAWDNMPVFDNDGTADSVITDAGTSANTYVVASGGAAVVLGHLVRATGFTNAANNKIFRVASSTGTTIVGASLSLTAETAPPGTARIKVVGFEGASADITATASGLGSTSLNFTTLGLKVGQWVKIGGTLTGEQFATAANNGWARITAIAATALTLDNLPSGWSTDAGTGKTIRVWVGDMIKNGISTSSMTIEKGFMAQTTPTYIVNRGQVVNTLEISMQSRQKITWAATFTGMGGGQSTTSLDVSPDAAQTEIVMAGNANVGRLGEAGVQLVAPNWGREFSININNNQRQIEALDSTAPVDIQPGECLVTGRMASYFGSNALLQKFYAGTPTSINSRAFKNSQAVIFEVPRAVYRSDGNPVVSGKNTDVMLPLGYQASFDSLTSAHVIFNRLEYVEATS